MKTIARLLSIAGLALLAAGMVSDVKATPILITTLDLSAFPPYGDADVQAGINNAIAAWNVANDPDLPTTGIGSTPNFKADKTVFGEDQLSITLNLGAYNYVFLHWGGPNVDGTYKNPELYYIGGDSGLTTFNAPFNTAPDPDKQYGLSFYSFYSSKSVPDGGSTLALVGFAVAGLGFLRRKLS